MDKGLQSILSYLQQDKNMSAEDKKALLKSINDTEQELTKVADQLKKTEKRKQDTSILLDKKSAELALKNRELEIEAALEKVRARTMAMQKSDELLEAGEILYQELDKLGIASVTCLYGLMDAEEKTVWYYGVNPEDGSILKEPISTPCTETQPMRSITASWKKKEPFYILELDPQETIKHQTFIAEHSTNFPYTAEELLSFSPKRLILQSFNFKQGYLLIVGAEKLSADQVKMMVRFAKVFELTYRRFLDLQKAEAQAREAKIEAALEKVRSRTMGMQKSEELPNVATVLFQQVKSLGIAQWTCGFNIWETGDNECTFYPGSPDGEILAPCKIPLNEHPIFMKFEESRRRGDEFYFFEKEGKVQEDHYKYMLAHPGGMDKLLQGMLDAGHTFPSFQIDHLANFSHGNLVFITYEHVPEMHDVFKRFAKVFEQTYTRFLDLQKAEEQAKEARIEVALEKVRSKTMAMHESNQLNEVIGTVFEQLQQFDMLLDGAQINIFDGSKDLNLWVSIPNKTYAELIHIPYFEHRYLSEFWKKKQKGETFITHLCARKEKDVLFKHLFKHSDLKNAPNSRKKFILDSKGWATSTAVVKNAYLIMYNFSAIPYSDVENEILNRFSKVFEQTYARFLDLQKSEAQAREAQIEAALERIRSRTLAMHKSEDLSDVATVLFKQLKELGGNLWGCGFVLLDTDNPEGEFWMNAEGKFQPPIYIPNTKDPSTINMYKGWKEGAELYSEDAGGDALKEHYNYLLSLPKAGHVFDGMIEAGLSFPTWQQWHAAYFSHGYLLVITKEPYKNADLFKRFAKVFDQTYRRFLDLQKAEAQAREAQIEATLERVRSRSLAMHKSEELQEVVNAVYDGFRQLDVKMASTNFVIFLEGTRDMDLWIGAYNHIFSELFHVPYIDFSPTKQVMDAREDGIDFLEINCTFEEKNRWHRMAFENSDLKHVPDKAKKLILESKSWTASWALEKYSAIQINRYSGEPFSKRENDILRRVAKVFEQAYVRFLDLQKAEEQTREAQIETALERVRSRSLAMHKSEELQDVVNIFYKKLIELDIKTDTANIIIFPDSGRDFDIWLASSNSEYKTRIHIPAIEFGPSKELMDTREDGGNFGFMKCNFKEKNKWFKYAFEHSDMKYVPEERKQFVLESKLWTTSFALAKYTAIQISSYTRESFTEKENEILKRFANVFEQAYVRFLDLQKAEEQTREAQIEAALERLRSRMMGMQNSSELEDTNKVMHEQLESLGIVPQGASVYIAIVDDDTKTAIQWLVNDKSSKTPLSQSDITTTRIPMTEHPLLKATYKGWKKKEPMLIRDLKGKSLIDFMRYFQSLPSFKEFDVDLTQLPKRMVWSEATFSQGTLGMIHIEPLPDATLDILIRFSKVIEQTYTRFLDIQKAEDQAREAQIEASLERVRSQSMAMQHSTELNLVLTTVFEELVTLKIEFERCVIWIYNEDERSVRWWAANPEAESGTESFLITDQDHPVYHEYWKAWEERRIKYFYLLEGENKQSWTNILFTQTELSRLPEEVKIGMMKPEKIHLYNTFNDFGVLFISSAAPISDDNFSIIERFGNVFNQSYTRFKDIQKAEIRAKEALKQSSLDRLRAKIASMRTATDLEQIIPSIWKELDMLGVPFIRCGVFIMDENNKSINTYLSAPDGRALGSFDMAYDMNEFAINVVLNWKKEKIYQTSWSKKEFIAFIKDLVDRGLLKDASLYQGATSPPDVLYLNFTPFNQGMLYVGNIEKLSNEHIELVQALAKAFAIAYARYEDFKQLEEAKKRIENTLTDLKSAQSQLIQSEKMASLGELTSGIAHEIQNPLNFVNNFSEVSEELLDELEEEIKNNSVEGIKEILMDLKQNLNKINHHGQRASGIVKGMLDHSRTSSGERVLTDINVLADEYLRLAYHGLRAKDKTFSADFKAELDETIPKISIVAQDFGRVILNLINNAFYAVSEKAKISEDAYRPTVIVTTKKLDKHIQISVKDNGNGIPKDLVDKIFQPFFTTKPTGEGTGLGLSLSYDIVKAHGGEINVETKKGIGSEFIIYLPLNNHPII